MSRKLRQKIIYLTGVTDSAKPWVLTHSPLFSAGASLILVENPPHWFREIEFWLKEKKKKTIPSVSLLTPLSYSDLSKKYQILRELKINQNSFIIAPRLILQKNLPSPLELQQNSLPLQLGQKVNLPKLIGFLVSGGYQKEKKAILPGTFAQRGGIIDIFPLFTPLENPAPRGGDKYNPASLFSEKAGSKAPPDLAGLSQHPVRLELWGDKIASIRKINTNEILKEIKIPPLLFKNPQGNILDWLSPTAKIILDEPEQNESLPLFQKRKPNLFIFQSFPPDSKNIIQFDFKTFLLYPEQKRNLPNFLESFQRKKYKIFIVSKLKTENLLSQQKSWWRLSSFCHFLPFNLPSGFQSPKERILVLTDKEILGFPKLKTRQRRYKIDPSFLEELKPGMYIVHIDHGIGHFAGMVQKKIDQHWREYFVLEYASGDKLFLPIDQADKITRYLGRANPTLHRLQGNVWHLIKKQTSAEAKKMATELLEVQAHRQTQKGFAFSADALVQQKLEDSFPYTETPDQERAILEVKHDMEGDRPMDRLICGDVGFGKTEIAIRAAFKALQDKKQVCLLAPTTILSQQHLDTFVERLKGWPVRPALLTRFQSETQQKEILRKLREGKVDILIGTHRLLSADVQFHDLGLVILDEEQRFGVRHKEKFKKMRASLDILTLSATPIPRTLQFALSGLRSLSIMETPPAGRKPIKTYVKLKNDDIIKKAINFELSRHGQVYYLYNRVETILAQAQRIQRLIPQAKIDVAHGQLPEKELASVMHEFDQGKIDILVSTTIIENGLDLPRVNTLIVENAPCFGLSQLYQMRGRIGRGTRQAYAYFLYNNKKLPPLARKRLGTLLQMQKLGSGFNIAMRDLEIRGAGNVLGREQSGNINAVGLYLYTQLLNQAISELKTGKKPKPILEVKVGLPLTACLPPSFVHSEEKRLSLYYELSKAANLEDVLYLQRKMEKEFGLLPEPVKNLLEILKIKILMRRARIQNMDTITIFEPSGKSKKRIILEFASKANWDGVAKLLQDNPAWIIGENKLKIDFSALGKNWLWELKKSLKILAQ